ncbi:ribbon-helix-helix domain-containing protein [Rhodobacteraceae bacterium NNCM2]|nr:ribbon-helix-helix domain-containing protein [Coraliihabitans acroporae]
MSFPRPVKRSLTLRGHRTSVSLEDPFWKAFCAIAEEKQVSVNALATELDEMREPPASLASAIRLFVLDWAQGNGGREG